MVILMDVCLSKIELPKTSNEIRDHREALLQDRQAHEGEGAGESRYDDRRPTYLGYWLDWGRPARPRGLQPH